MSYLVEEESPCSHCQFPNLVEVWTVLNMKEDPELRELLMGGELNMTECVACKKIFYAEHFLFYHDPEAELMAFVYPVEERLSRQKNEDKTKSDFAKLQENLPASQQLKYTPLSLFGLDELVRLLEAEDEASIQGAIVSSLAAPLGLMVKTISPFLARQQTLPRHLPFPNWSRETDRVGLIRALEVIEKENGQLTVYSSLRRKLVESPPKEIQF